MINFPFARLAAEMIDAVLSNNRVVIMPGQQHIATDTNTELFIGEALRFLLGKDFFQVA